jgi:hypothetical protein
MFSVPLPLLRNVLDAMITHQAGHTIQSAVQILVIQFLPYSGRSHESITFFVHVFDVLQEQFVGFVSLTR